MSTQTDITAQDTTIVTTADSSPSAPAKTQGADSNPLRQVREQLNAERQARQAAEARLAELERQTASESEESRSAKDMLEDAQSAAELAYTEGLESLPEQMRSVAELACEGKSYADKIRIMKAFKASLPSQIQPVGTVTQGAGATLSGASPDIKIDPMNPFSSYASQVGFRKVS